MPKIAKVSEVVNAVFASTKAAFRTYRSSSGYTLLRAPEFYIQVAAFERLKKMEGIGAVVLEDGTRRICEWMEVDRRSTKGLRHGRFDVVSYNSNDRARIIMEFKKNFADKNCCVKDAERVRKALKAKMADWGLVFYYTQANGRQTVLNRIDRVLFQTNLGAEPKLRLIDHIVCKAEINGYEIHWGMGCFGMSRRGV